MSVSMGFEKLYIVFRKVQIEMTSVLWCNHQVNNSIILAFFFFFILKLHFSSFVELLPFLFDLLMYFYFLLYFISVFVF